MFCSKCGAVVSGKFCSSCGQRIRTPLEEFRLEEKRRRRKIEELGRSLLGLPGLHIASACWLAVCLKYADCPALFGWYVPDSAFSNLEKADGEARDLFHEMVKYVTSQEEGEPT